MIEDLRIFAQSVPRRAPLARAASTLIAAGFKPHDADPCLFVLALPDGGRVLALLYVDDSLVAATSATLLAHWVKRITGMYKARQLGEPADFLNICLERDRAAGTLRMHQRPYIERLALLYPPASTRLQRPPPMAWSRRSASRRARLPTQCPGGR